ncbi:MAG: sulfotransferase [Kiloniellaceae bacterium]
MTTLAEKEILFVLGPARSGTTFLNNFLDRWFDYGMGPEGTFIEPFHRRLARYGDLSRTENLERLVEDVSRCPMLEIMRKKYRDANCLDVSPTEILARLPEPSFAGVVYSVFQCIADLQGKSRVGNKNPGYWTHLALLNNLFPAQARYIAILRDGRDVFLSLQGIPWGRHSAYAAARRWHQALTAIESFQQRCGPGRFLLLRYEDILLSPGDAIDRIEGFLGVTLAPEKRAAALAEARSNPKKGNFNKWPDRLSANDRRVFEALAGDMLAKHGYPVLAERPTLSPLEKRYFELMELKRLVQVNFYHLQNKLPGDTKRKSRETSPRS